jgi:hypothetical protein
MNKKAQLEMVGLVMIVVIVIIVLLIFMVMRLTTEPKDIRKEYLSKEMANDFLVAALRTNVEDCDGESVLRLAADVSKTLPAIVCNDRPSKVVLKETLKELLNKTLDDWGVDYNLTLKEGNINFNQGCQNIETRDRAYQIIPLYPGQTQITLDICR